MIPTATWRIDSCFELLRFLPLEVNGFTEHSVITKVPGHSQDSPVRFHQSIFCVRIDPEALDVST